MKFRLSQIVFFTWLGFAVNCFSQDEFKVKLNGTNNYITVLPGTENITLWAISEGKMSSYLEVSGSFPKKTKIKAKAALIKTSVKRAKQQRRKQYPIDLLPSVKLAEAHSSCLEISVEGSEPEEEDLINIKDYPAIESPVCDEIGKDVLSELAVQLSGTFGGTWKPGNACAYLLSEAGDVWLDPKEWCDKLSEEEIAVLEPFGLDCNPDDEGDGSGSSSLVLGTTSIRLKGLIHKDSCSEKDRYLVLITLDFRKNSHLITQPTKFSVRINETKRESGKEAALKPQSEGRYAPRPIIMMNWMGNSCGNKIEVIRWEKDKPKKQMPLSIYALLSYKNMVLNLAVVQSALIGGQGTAELFTGREAYGVCFDLDRKRQNMNGYPG